MPTWLRRPIMAGSLPPLDTRLKAAIAPPRQPIYFATQSRRLAGERVGSGPGPNRRDPRTDRSGVAVPWSRRDRVRRHRGLGADGSNRTGALASGAQPPSRDIPGTLDRGSGGLRRDYWPRDDRPFAAAAFGPRRRNDRRRHLPVPTLRRRRRVDHADTDPDRTGEPLDGARALAD